MEEKKVVDFYHNDVFLFRLGQVSYLNVHASLAEHTHGDMLEIVFMTKGCQTYYVEDKMYVVHGGDIFITYPGEVHGSGSMPEDKASFFYLIVDVENICKEGFGLVEKECGEFLAEVKTGSGRLRKGSTVYTGSCLELLKLCKADTLLKNTRIRNCLSGMLVGLALGKPEGQAEVRRGMDIICDYIEENIKEDISIDSLAGILHVSTSWFKRCFTEAVGIPPGEYILRRKVLRCQKELESNRRNITDIAHEYGFSSSQYFSTVFKKYCGLTPSAFRANQSEKEWRK